ncbi:MAG: dihydrofolate reductase family protein [Thermomicrobiales bacterium]
MRKIINSTFVSLDGVINHMDRWHFQYGDDESAQLALEQLNAADTLLMGRNTYEVFAAAWPSRVGVMADKMNTMPKLVASTTLTNPEWDNTTVLSGELVPAVRDLKQQNGGPILMYGFGPIAKTLLREGLLDVIHLWYNPAFAGVGGPDDVLLTPGLNCHLTHTATRTLRSGMVMLSYQTN